MFQICNFNFIKFQFLNEGEWDGHRRDIAEDDKALGLEMNLHSKLDR